MQSIRVSTMKVSCFIKLEVCKHGGKLSWLIAVSEDCMISFAEQLLNTAIGCTYLYRWKCMATMHNIITDSPKVDMIASTLILLLAYSLL